jgi:ferredoxin
MVCADIIGMTMNDVATIGAAYERGLGPKDISEVEVLGDIELSDVRIADFKRATEHQSITFEGNGAFNAVKAFAFKIAFSSKPQVKKDECIGCKKCFETCPASAITMVTAENKTGRNGKIPQIDRSKCIKCFCCQEFCPVGAMKVKNNALGRLVKKIG